MKIGPWVLFPVRGAKTPFLGGGLVNIGLTKKTHEQIVLRIQRSTIVLRIQRSTIVLLFIIAKKRLIKEKKISRHYTLKLVQFPY